MNKDMESKKRALRKQVERKQQRVIATEITEHEIVLPEEIKSKQQAVKYLRDQGNEGCFRLRRDMGSVTIKKVSKIDVVSE